MRAGKGKIRDTEGPQYLEQSEAMVTMRSVEASKGRTVLPYMVVLKGHRTRAWKWESGNISIFN